MSCVSSTKCRTCLCDSHLFHQLYDYVDENYKILEILDDLVPQIEIKTSSQFSSLVCQSCVDKLVVGYKFQKLCIETNKRLHDMIGPAVFKTEPKLENILDPLAEEASFQIEIEEDACFESEMNLEEPEDAMRSDNDDWGPGHETDIDTDSSNEKLSVLKERKDKKSPSKPTDVEKRNRNNHRKGHFPCTECGKVFYRSYNLKRHAAVHLQMRAYRCEICKYSCAAEKTFKTHMLTHENAEITKTEIDDRNESKEINDSNDHNDSKEERKNKKSPSEPTDVEKRNRNNHRKGHFPCTECGKVFNRSYNLKRHAAVHLQMRASRCEICKYSCAAEKTFKTHMLTDENAEITKTEIDDRNESKEINDSNEHNDSKEENCINKEIQTFQCPDCPKCFEKKASPSTHYKVHTKKTKNKFIKDTKNEDVIEDVEKTKELENEKELQKNMEEVTMFIVKEETKVTPQIFEEPMYDLDAHAEWFNNDYDDSDDNSDKNLFAKSGTKHTKNIDIIYTGLGEIEKPNSSNKRSDSFPCEVCGRVFDRLYGLKRHSSVHSLTKPHECEICKYRFATVNILKAHMVQHDGDSNGNLTSQSRPEGFKCRYCPRRFEKQVSLSAHRQIHNRNAEEANYPCMVCQRNFMSVRCLIAHITNKHPEVEKHKCDQCDKTFVLHAHLVEHLNRHKGNKNLVCLICEKEFRYNKNLKEHMRTHSGKKYKCPQCGKAFKSLRNLRPHMERHSDLKKYLCSECPKRFKCRADLHVCDICGSRFTHVSSLHKHKQLHSGEIPFQCAAHMKQHDGDGNGKLTSQSLPEGFKCPDCPHLCPQCGKAFKNARYLRQHMERHTDLKKYQCPECPSRFKCLSDMIKHKSIHNAKPILCDICGTRFTRAYSLQKHKLLHSGERPFKCDQCSMTFTRICHLRCHMRTHTGEKPYKCKYCERAYSASGDLTKHLRSHVGENTYMCDQCPMAFKYQAELKQHQSEHYKMAQKTLQQAQKMSEEA